ncbi:hypothetical protein BTHE68_71950 (plasmid) [Burkholderia sp. THE68]|nr:hypothetical protein BTHE68_71950 [Burkholderia sp. THE68]
MSLRILWTEKAREELRERMAFIAQRSPMAATKLFDQILDSVVPASEHPYLFPRCHGSECTPVQPTPKPTPCYGPFCGPISFLIAPNATTQVKGLFNQQESL